MLVKIFYQIIITNSLISRLSFWRIPMDGRLKPCEKQHGYLHRIWTQTWHKGLWESNLGLLPINSHTPPPILNFNMIVSCRFYNLILLPAVRNNISDYKKLNYHLYMALKKAIYKPAAFFKGIILPLCEVKWKCHLNRKELKKKIYSVVKKNQKKKKNCV